MDFAGLSDGQRGNFVICRKVSYIFGMDVSLVVGFERYHLRFVYRF